MYNKKNNKTLSGTVEETRMKLSNKGTPVFEIYHNDTKSIVDIVYYTENKTSFTMDNTPPPPDSKQYVGSDNIAYYYITEHVCKLTNNICRILCC